MVAQQCLGAHNNGWQHSLGAAFTVQLLNADRWGKSQARRQVQAAGKEELLEHLAELSQAALIQTLTPQPGDLIESTVNQGHAIGLMKATLILMHSGKKIPLRLFGIISFCSCLIHLLYLRTYSRGRLILGKRKRYTMPLIHKLEARII